MSNKRFISKNISELLPDRITGICVWCKGTVSPPKRYWCSPECIDEWLIRRSSSFLRRKTYERDKGICAVCGINTMFLKEELKRISLECNRFKLILSKSQRYSRSSTFNLFKKSIGFGKRTSYWDADHIIPVHLGGGECGLENIQTLCIGCHKTKTKMELMKSE